MPACAKRSNGTPRSHGRLDATFSRFIADAMSDLWNGLKPGTRAQLNQRDYAQKSLAERLRSSGVEAGELIAGRATLTDACSALASSVSIMSLKRAMWCAASPNVVLIAVRRLK